MKTRLALLSTLVMASLFATKGQAAPVAVMPVRGVNLSEGQSDAIAVFFSNAFARDAHVVVASPAESKPVWAELRNSAATAQRLGASQYVELTAVRLAAKVTLAGILFGADGREIYRAETWARSLDEMDTVAARLARALIWRQPVPLPTEVVSAPSGAPEPAADAPAVAESAVAPAYPGNMYGMKAAMSFPVASKRSFEPQLGLEFDARIGPREHFIEAGVGFAAPLNDDSSATGARMTAFFIELGGSVYLNEGSVGLYLGGGAMPGLWKTEYQTSDYTYSGESVSTDGFMFPLYAQMGINFTRDLRTRLFAEFRLSQHLLKVRDSTDNQDYHPTVLALQFGAGW